MAGRQPMGFNPAQREFSQEREITMKSKLNVLVVLSALIATSEVRAADIDGTWSVTIESSTSKSSSTLVLKGEGAAITGSYTGQFADAQLTGTLSGNDIVMSFKTESQGVPLDITYVGTVDGNVMKGTVTVVGFGEGAFVGVRQ